MYKNLEKLALSKFYDLSILKKTFIEWIDCSVADRADFTEQRERLVKKYSGVYFDHGVKLQTSGSTCGIKKKYLWGPCFQEQYDFFEWLKFRWFDYDNKYYIKIKWNKDEKLWIKKINSKSSIINFPIKTNSNLLKKFLYDLGSKKFILEIIPTYSKYLIKENFDLSVFDPEEFLIYSTGEKSTQLISDYYNKFGIFYLDGMRCWTGGATFITCQYKKQHWIDMLSKNLFNKNNELITTDLFNLAQNFISYPVGDRVKSERSDLCACGLPIDKIEFIEKNISLEDIGLSKFSYQDLFNLINEIIYQICGHNNEVLICTFGRHDKSNSIVIFCETTNKVKDWNKIIDKFKEITEIKNNIYVFEERKMLHYKYEKITSISDEDFLKIKKSYKYIKFI